MVDCLFLGWIGANSPDDAVAGISFLTLGRIGTAYYFGYFVSVFVVSIVETPKPLPASISEPVLKGAGGMAAGAAAKPIRNLSRHQLRGLREKISQMLKKEHRLDPYSIAHLSEANVLIEKALDGQYIYNLDDIRVRLTIPSFFMEPAGQDPRH